MKAAATALVLIAGAAVVLWYGNTVNSWVLGGLIGGLAALLISIPISLFFFSYLSRRREETQELEREEMFLARSALYAEVPPYARKGRYEVEGSLYSVDEELWREEQEAPRQMRAPHDLRRLPPPQTSKMAKSQQLRRQDASRYAEQEEFVTRKPPTNPEMHEKQNNGRRTTQHLRNSGNLYGSKSQLSLYKSDAMRTARLEAAKQQEDDDEYLPPSSTQQRSSLSSRQPTRKAQPPRRPTRQLEEQTQNIYPKKRRTASTTNLQSQFGRQPSPQNDAPSTDTRRPDRFSETEIPNERFARTEPIDRQANRYVRKSRERAHNNYDPETTTGNLQKPLVRRAPYMYDDDALRQELAPYSDNPIARRSSRHEMMPQDDDEE